MTIDREYKLAYGNKALMKSMEKSGMVLEKGFDTLLFYSGEQIPLFKAYYERVFAGETFEVQEYFNLNNMDSYYSITYAPIYNELNEIVGAAIFGKDITEIMMAKKETEKLLKESQLQAEELTAQSEELRQNMEELAATNELVEAQKNALSDQNLRLTDSIKYAERIQTAILPPATQLRQAFENHFVIFQPKDIVSGDFYWYSQLNGMGFIAAVDCTGHGVPGAFMSMIGNTLLNQIVNEKKITETNQILNTLHRNVLEALNQRDSSNVDGMDVAICRIKPISKGKFEVSYSGAKCPMFYTSNGNLNLLKPDRKSIGGREHSSHEYSCSTVELQAGDTVYLTTDGMIDAANFERKRFGTKNLMSAIEKHQNRPLYEQKIQLERLLDEYQQGSDQRDDITMVAFQLPA
jgi:serine phosphatase RsbU (regulator of sigma subunit)